MEKFKIVKNNRTGKFIAYYLMLECDGIGEEYIDWKPYVIQVPAKFLFWNYMADKTIQFNTKEEAQHHIDTTKVNVYQEEFTNYYTAPCRENK